MEKCRLCLKNGKKLKSVFDTANNEVITIAAMLNSIANVKASKCDGLSDRICVACQRKTEELWDFKLQVERSHMVLQENVSFKKIYFSNLHETELSKDIKQDDFKKPVAVDFTRRLLNNRGELFKYNDTVIQKVQCNMEKPLTVLDLVNSIKDENEIDYQDDYSYEVDIEYDPDDNTADHKIEQPIPRRSTRNKQMQYNPENVADLVYPLKEKLARTKKSIRDDWDNTDPDFVIKLPHKKRLRRENKAIGCEISKDDHFDHKKQLFRKDKENLIVLPNPIKPVYLEAYTLVPHRTKLNSDKKETKYMRICPYCGKMSKSLNKHLRTHSDIEKLIKCDQCTSTFVLSKELENHMKVAHGPKTVKCDQCYAVFTTKCRLTSHMRVHSPEKKYICKVCNKGFKRSAARLRHVRLMHSVGPKPLQCELCPDTFHGPTGLKHHMRVHTKERPYRCEICSQPYSYKHDFNRHCLKKHGVWFKRRSVNVLNDEVLAQERVLMRDMLLRLDGILRDDKPVNPFEGPQAAMAFDLMIKAIQSGKVVVDLQL